MIKQFSNYDNTQAYTGGEEKLPRGGYVCKITGTRIEEGNYGQRVKIAFDIAEGDYAGYFQAKFDRNTNEDKKWSGTYQLYVPKDDGSREDEWTKRSFKTFTNALEDSNTGYHFDWDESKFKGKLVGIIFNWREYDFNGQTGFTPNAAQAASVKDIREGKYKIPDDKFLKKKNSKPLTAADQALLDSFVNIPAGAEEEPPF